VYHIERLSKGTELLGSDIVRPRPGLIRQYDLIRAHSRNLVFRGQLVRNLLDDRPWYTGFGRLFDTHDMDLFFDEGYASFRTDVRLKFVAETGAEPA
jgi:CRISPR-associated protein Cmx8